MTASVGTGHAQSFFATNVLDPTVGADRGSASQIRDLDEPTRFLTFSTTGSDAAGRAVVGFGLGLPDIGLVGDQLDFAAVVAGPSEDGGRELLAGGVAYRVPLGSPATMGFASIDYGDLILGTTEGLAFDVTADRLQVAAGVAHTMALQGDASLRFGAEVIGRRVRSESFGFPVIDEDLRMVRGSLLYSKGRPFGFQRRFSLAATKGFSDFGASPEANPNASVPGATTDFLRVAFAAEASLPLSARWLVNAGVIGQWTEDSLPSSQRCGFETNAYARGFDYATVIGDRCFGGRGEVAYNFLLPEPGASQLTLLQGFAGLDMGLTDNVANPLLAANDDRWSSLSAGIRGLRGDFLGEISATRILDAPDAATGQDENRIWLRAALQF